MPKRINHPANHRFIFAIDSKNHSKNDISAELGAAILKNLSELIVSADSEVTGERSVDLKLRATPEGSFEFLFKIIELAIDSPQTKLFITDANVTIAIAYSLGLMENAPGLIDLLLFLKGKEGSVTNSIGGEVTVEGNNSGQITVTKNVYHLYQNPEVRTSLSELAKAVQEESNENYIQIRDPKDKKPIKTIKAEELEYFLYEEPEDIIHESSINTDLKVIKAIYEGQSKWRMKHEGQPIEVRILDSEWLRRFQLGLVAAPPRSILSVTMLKKTPMRNNKVTGVSKYEITKISKVTLPPKQKELF